MVAKTYANREAFLTEVIRPFNARKREPLRPQLREIYAEGDVVIVLFDASSVALDGEPYTNTYTWDLRMRGDRIVAATAFFDSIAFDEMWTRVAPE
jgi:ketosteroid isomerase-like protein